jgi:hypothetical protein
MIDRIRSSRIIFLCCFGMLVAGCGKKSPPKPARQEKLPRVMDLQAVPTVAGVRLRWTMGSSDNKVAGFKVYRSQFHPETPKCPGCARDYTLIATIQAKNGQTRFQAMDSSVDEKGRAYYKVIPFDKKDGTGPDSNEARVLLE